MKIKRFRAPDMRTALEMVRAEMGRDAVILQSRPVRARGWRGWLGRGRRWVEVTAAWDGEGPPARAAEAKGSVPAGGRGAAGAPEPAGWDGPAPAALPTAAGTAPAAARRLDVAVGDGPLVPPVVPPPRAGGAGGPEPALPGVAERRAQDPGTSWARAPGGEAGGSGAVAAVAPTAPPLPPRPAAPPHQPAHRMPLADSPWAEPAAAAAGAPGNLTARQPTLPPPAPPLAGTVAVVGPTGAGKTTVVASLAARALLDEGREVALLAADTYRLGATSALSAYADLLGVPLEVAYAPGEVAAWAGVRPGGADHRPEEATRRPDRVALVDTAGRNLLLPEVAAELAALVQAARPDRVLLVLPATLAPAEAAALVGVGRRLGVTDLVLTKLDECLDPRAALARAARWGLPLALVGVGQRVPDDLLPGTPEALEPWLAGAAVPEGGSVHGDAGARSG
ncbi:GTP-binding signal recognition particle SRP54 G- domain [Thermaerobacter marianensis DSM 12885]|uniref:GTP-binding signal recognition particle SRP54 G-domain n=1 Tax=Thermaerobacter marianensis (strain ATCC 700841 / DSM 12885 / JCM 10246 / 7p75a) TaxID=644966 RepID=E6SJP7_THEM7|nr:GTP-binding signal recognition particle SRP54 G- domain [Thermaerobacter marianensis]ADU51110.1 GTP-binding signal recognition particle SRP54 G- domain [Thermaerobacter marianensis DSM 12885]